MNFFRRMIIFWAEVMNKVPILKKWFLNRAKRKGNKDDVDPNIYSLH
jgi:hypothetical protein